MCELMGISFSRPTSAGHFLQAFGARGEENTHGWGLAWYPDRAAAVVKEPIKWRDSRLSRFLESNPSLQSEIFIAHVRYMTTGEAPCYAETHPFLRECMGREYCFMHNGTLEGIVGSISTGRFTPLGTTDSEWAFCYLMGEIENRGGHLDSPSDWEWLHGRLRELNRRGKLNMLLSDGFRLFAYHDLGAWKGLSFRNLDPQSEGSSENPGHVLATYPLDDGNWTSFQVGELMVFESGRIRYSSHRTIGD